MIVMWCENVYSGEVTLQDTNVVNTMHSVDVVNICITNIISSVSNLWMNGADRDFTSLCSPMITPQLAQIHFSIWLQWHADEQPNWGKWSLECMFPPMETSYFVQIIIVLVLSIYAEKNWIQIVPVLVFVDIWNCWLQIQMIFSTMFSICKVESSLQLLSKRDNSTLCTHRTFKLGANALELNWGQDIVFFPLGSACSFHAHIRMSGGKAVEYYGAPSEVWVSYVTEDFALPPGETCLGNR